mmetsp:Transcript_1643/g.5101  ORF Transcript_1643/g.5101 Transcript_1643/m.5101 type:complete len:438 (+) Transcript_1643:470-1783(+)
MQRMSGLQRLQETLSGLDGLQTDAGGGGDPALLAVAVAVAVVSAHSYALGVVLRPLLLLLECALPLAIELELTLLLQEELLLGSLPHAHAAVRTAGDHGAAARRERHAPQLRVVGGQTLHLLEGVRVPHVQCAVLAARPQVVRARHEAHAGDGVAARTQRTMAVAKVQTPQLHLLVRTAAGQQQAVVADRHGQHRQRVPVQLEVEAQRVQMVDADRRIQQRHRQILPRLVLRRLDLALATHRQRQHLVAQLQLVTFLQTQHWRRRRRRRTTVVLFRRRLLATVSPRSGGGSHWSIIGLLLRTGLGLVLIIVILIVVLIVIVIVIVILEWREFTADQTFDFIGRPQCKVPAAHLTVYAAGEHTTAVRTQHHRPDGTFVRFGQRLMQGGALHRVETDRTVSRAHHHVPIARHKGGRERIELGKREVVHTATRSGVEEAQ